MKVVQALQPHWLSYIYFIAIVVNGVVVDYASALQEQEQPPKQLQHTEVNYTESESPRLGAEIVVYPVAKLNNNHSKSNNNSTVDHATPQQQQRHLVENKKQQQQEEDLKPQQQQYEKLLQQQQEHLLQQQQQQGRQHEPQTHLQQPQIPVVVQAIDSSNIRSSMRVARRLDAPPASSAQLVVPQQYDAPLVKKNSAINISTTNTSSTDFPAAIPTVFPQQRRRSASSRSNTGDSRKSAVGTTATQPTRQRSHSFGSKAQQSALQQTPARTQNSNSTNAIKSQRRRDDERRGKAQLQQSESPAIGTNSSTRRNMNKSRQDISSTNKSVSATVKTKPQNAAVTFTSTSTPSTSTTVRPQESFNFIPSNPFSFFSPSLWALSRPPKPASTKKPPKKYTPTPGAATTTPAKIKKSSNRKNKVTTTTTTTPKTKPTTSKPTTTRTTPIIPKHTSSTTTTQTPNKVTTEGPFRIALPTFNFFGAQAPKSAESGSEKDKRNTAVQNLRSQYDCPRENEVRFQLFPKICKTDGDCTVWNRNELCCEIFGAKSCVSGVIKPLEETSHSPILGLIPRKCPTRPLAELWWQVEQCETDSDCWPRVCCPDGNKRYCRTSQPELETVPVPVKRSFNYLSEYLECTPAPPPIFDLHPKTCESTLDCFPNVCCQEAGLRHCRPPKKSLLTWMANILNVDFVKRLAQNIVIK
ncbi:probable basic-leucine zipper transcription factor Q [Eurosta solidaginis]|uniref:probable basic-leucine zipper transcription factor Q n=1 Tax=Eurosta solidaginis TaxID=178769 RepID=UPI003530DD56